MCVHEWTMVERQTKAQADMEVRTKFGLRNYPDPSKNATIWLEAKVCLKCKEVFDALGIYKKTLIDKLTSEAAAHADAKKILDEFRKRANE